MEDTQMVCLSIFARTGGQRQYLDNQVLLLQSASLRFVDLITRKLVSRICELVCTFIIRYVYGVEIALALVSGLCVAWSETGLGYFLNTC